MDERAEIGSSEIPVLEDTFAWIEYGNVSTEISFLGETIAARIDSNYTTMNPIMNLTGVSGASTQLKLYDVLVPLIGGLIVITNLVVVLSSGLLLKKGVNPRTTYLFLGNVAMADLITGVAVLLGLIVSSTLASIYSVGLIAIDRFLYIIHGLKYHRWVYPTRARLLIAFCWGLGIILGFLPATGLWSGGTQGGKICWFISVVPPGLVLLITVIGLLPVLLVVILYGIILYHAISKVIQLRRADRDKEAQTAGGQEDLRIFRGGNSGQKYLQNRSERRKPSKVKAVKVVLFTCGSFVLTWIPYFVASSMYAFCDQTAVTGNCRSLRMAIASPLAILGFFNSLLNPLIYAWWHNGFRTFMRKILCKGRDTAVGTSSSTTKSSSAGTRSQSRRSQSDGSQSDGDRPHGNMRIVQLEETGTRL